MNSIARRRRAIIAAQEEQPSGRIPREYQEVEYIHGASGAYLNTGIIPVVNPRVVTSVRPTNTDSKRRYIFGVNSTTTPYFYILNYYTSGNNVTVRYGSSDTSVAGRSILKQTTTFVPLDCSNIFKINNETVKSYTAVSFENNTNPVVLNRGQSSDTAYPGIYDFKETFVYDGTELKADLVPCYRKSDNKVGMYDLIRETFIAGSGTWTKGANVT